MGNGIDAGSANFAEDFVPASEALINARQEAVGLGADLPSDATLAFLTFTAKALNAKAVVEIGTGSGATGLALFNGMNPDGILTSIDTEVDRQAAARKVFTAQQIPTRRFRLIAGVALDVLPKLQEASYDLVYINGNKLEYVEYLEEAIRLLRYGGAVVVDHSLWRGLIADLNNEDDETVIIREALQYIQTNEDLTPVMLPIGDGVVAAIKS